MAWLCTGKTNAELIANMARSSIIQADRVERAMCKVDRVNYVIDKEDAYQDSPQVIGHGATISAPHMHAYATEHLLPFLHPGARVLDVGSGSGYLAAVFHHLVSSPEKSGHVVGIEHIPELVDWSVENLHKDGLAEALDKKEIELLVGDGRLDIMAPRTSLHKIWTMSTFGYAASQISRFYPIAKSLPGPKIIFFGGKSFQHQYIFQVPDEPLAIEVAKILEIPSRYEQSGPYDAIHVGAAAPTLPVKLVEQLASPGRMFIPVGTFAQHILHVDKDVNGKVTETRIMDVRYVPLTDRESQR